jgi:hypothetical protein
VESTALAFRMTSMVVEGNKHAKGCSVIQVFIQWLRPSDLSSHSSSAPGCACPPFLLPAENQQ